MGTSRLKKIKVLFSDFWCVFREALIKVLIFRLRLNDRKDPTVRRSEKELSRPRECPVQSPED